MRGWVALAWLAGAPLVAQERPVLTPVLRPVLEEVEPAVAELLGERLDRLETQLETAPLEALAGEFGETGKLLLVYNLPESAESCLMNAARLDPEEFSWPYLIGSLRQRRGDLGGSLQSFETAREIDPTDPSLLVRLAQVQFELGATVAAEAIYRELIDVEGFGAAANYGLGRLALDGDDLERAIRHLELALEEQPQASQVRYQLGVAHRRAGDRDRARELLSDRGAGQLQFPDPQMTSLAVDVRGVEVYLAAGRKARNRGDLPSALAAFQKAALEEPDEPEHWDVLGATLLEMGRFEDAVGVYRRVMELDPDDPSMLYNLAGALTEVGEHAEAEALLLRLVGAHSDHVDARANLATLYGWSGRLAEAEALLDEAIAIDPDDPTLAIQRASTRVRAGRAREARSDLQRVLRDDPTNAEALVILGRANEALGSPGDALSAWRRAAESDGSAESRGQAHYLISRALLAQGRAPEAATELRSAIELLPANAALYQALGDALGATSDFAGAVEQYDEALAIAPSGARAHFGKAMALLLDGQEAAARDHLRRSLTLVEEPVELEHLLARVLAAATDAAVRDGEAAVRRAQSVFERSSSIATAETLAMAFAELGRFDEALRWQTQIIERAKASGQISRLAALEAARERFERGEAIRTPWLPDR